ncbi:beta-3-deoxy-D-manno-oct-2-ulosonic acid transferase [Sphingobium sp.]|uniref:capsular polysaccharide export protein, LipB/KpsS family n=1 Tax=Sphingobium sp. TaxID=1912891 RepID=UPI00260B2032|nr:beta-3-deoxy-D-manno-oct-2-ulosonic acid transferase [Sphingobium sp.]
MRDPGPSWRMTPFLRSPPFPNVDPAVAAVSLPVDGRAAVPVTEGMLDQLRVARVGGCFWGARPDPVRRLVRVGTPLDARVFADMDPDQIGLLPGKGAAHVAGRMLPADCDPWHMIEGAQAIHAGAEDEWSLIAGLMGVPVIGADGVAVEPARLHTALRARLTAVQYRDPFSGGTIDVTQAIAQLADWRRHLDGNRGLSAASGMAFWKREAIQAFLWDGERSPPFLSARRGLRKAQREGGALAVWPSRVPAAIVAQAEAEGIPVARVEDGFLRSRGLGAALHPPGSIVVDRSGIYYNALGPNDLEKLLATQDFPPALVERAARLRARICASGVTKYGAQGGGLPALPKGRRTVLAVGQVDDDLSVRLGGAGVVGNLDFLQRVRRAEPDAFILYRPHPDVQAGHRKGHLTDAAALAHADAIDSGGSLMELVQAVDAVHVLSSLTGFEALIRGCAVTVHGMPFYVGWGLTRDLAPPSPRRGRQRTIDALVAAALILYPRYLDPVTRLPCGPEVMVERLANGSTPPVTWLIRVRAMQGKLRRFMTLATEFFHG